MPPAKSGTSSDFKRISPKPTGRPPNGSPSIALLIVPSGPRYSIGAYGFIVGGWASDSKYALLGAMRTCAQLVSYEVSLALSALMGGVSGSAIADAAMQSRMLGGAMVERGFTRGFAAGVLSFGAVLTPVIPPGIGMILYGSIGQVSIGRLFAAGFLPAFLLWLALAAAVSITARRRGYRPERDQRPTLGEVGGALRGGLWALLFPVFLLLGLRMGVFTPSEIGAFAVVYGLVIGFAAETEDLSANARRKLAAKGCDWIVANDVSREQGTFGGVDNSVQLIRSDAEPEVPREPFGSCLRRRRGRARLLPGVADRQSLRRGSCRLRRAEAHVQGHSLRGAQPRARQPGPLDVARF